MNRRNRYHTDFIFKAKIGQLSTDERALVPNSTFSDWQGRDFSNLVGFDADDHVLQQIEFHRRFITVKGLAVSAKCLYTVYSCYSTLLDSAKSKMKLFRANKELLCDVVLQLSEDISITSACDLIGIRVNRFYRWVNQKACSSSAFQLCRKTNSQQLTKQEQKTVESVLVRPELKDKPWVSAYFRMMKEGIAYMNYSTFCRYATQLSGESLRFKKPKQKKGKRSSKPFELLHMDTTVVKFMDGTKGFLHLIVDNFSRAILGHKVARTCSSSLAMENLKEVCEKHNLHYKPITLWCDNGSENEGKVNEFLLRPDIAIEKQICQLEIDYSNSMSEAANKRLKYFHLLPRRLQHYEELLSCLPEVITNENNREQGSLYGYTPNEVLSGKIPDKHLFSKQIQNSKKNRSAINRKEKCSIC